MSAENDYFDDARIAVLLRRAEAWRGTPFRENQAVLGRGASCSHFARALYAECGIMDIPMPPAYNPRLCNHTDESVVEQYLAGLERLRLLNAESAKPGDLALFRVGKIPWHLAVLLRSPTIIHAVSKHGVVTGQLDDPMWASRLHAIYRFSK